MPPVICATFCVAFEVMALSGLIKIPPRDVAVACDLTYEQAFEYTNKLVENNYFLSPPIYINGTKYNIVYMPRVVCKELLR